MNDKFDKLLWSCNKSDRAYSSSVWISIINKLTEDLARYLDCKIISDDKPVIRSNSLSPSFCAEIEMFFSKHGPLILKAKG